MKCIVDRLGLIVFAMLSLAWVHQGRAAIISVDYFPSDPSVGVVAVDSGDGLCSLREAFLAANSEADFNECILTGNPSGPLQVDLPVTAPTFTLINAPYIGTGFDEFGPNGLPLVTGSFAIEGNDAVVQRDPATATPKFRLLQVAGGADLQLSNLSLQHGWTSTEQSYNNSGGCLLNRGSLHMDGVNVIQCTAIAGFGGGIYNDGTLSMTGGAVSDNQTDLQTSGGGYGGSGGGIFNTGDMTLVGVTVSNNRIGGTAGNGGGIYNGATMSIDNCTITGNDANWEGDPSDDTHRGGGVLNAAGDLTVINSVISNNHARLGGGLAAYGNNSTTVRGSTIRNNQAFDGGGMKLEGADGVVVIEGSTVDGNSAMDNGGGLHIAQGSTVVSNTTIVGNAADFSGGIHMDDELEASLLELSHVTLVDNAYCGMYVLSGDVRVDHSVLAPNGGDSCATSVLGSITSLGYNLDDDGSCGFTQTTDLSGVSPQLAALADNGGGTQTRRPLPGSPLIDAVPIAECGTGVPTGVDASADQRGIARPQGYGCDIGAVEIEPYVANLIAYGGSGQHTMAGDPFAWPLAVQARDAQGRAVADLALEISAPSSGASANCSPSSTDQTGVLLAYCTANQQLGTYAVSISIPGSRTISGLPLEQIFTLTNDSNDRIFGNGFESSPLAKMLLAPSQLVADVGFQIPQGLLAGRIVPILLVHDAQGHRVVLVEARRDREGTQVRSIHYDAQGYPAHFNDWQKPDASHMQAHIELRGGTVSSSLHPATQ